MEKLLKDTLQIEDGTCLLHKAHWIEERKGTGLLLKLMGSFPGTSLKVNITQLCLTLCDPMHCIVCGILQARILEWVAFLFSKRIFLAQGLNPGLLHCRQILYCLSHQGIVFIEESATPVSGLLENSQFLVLQYLRESLVS